METIRLVAPMENIFPLVFCMKYASFVIDLLEGIIVVVVGMRPAFINRQTGNLLRDTFVGDDDWRGPLPRHETRLVFP